MREYNNLSMNGWQFWVAYSVAAKINKIGAGEVRPLGAFPEMGFPLFDLLQQIPV